MSTNTHTNRLAQETSPYLLQHAHNPVDWYPWGPEALEKARRENKPILLSVGYSACHWCHVMERESFENEQTARLMNENYVCIKVDREERPDLDDIYMQATIALSGHGGWPMNVFLTPDLKPFFAGTYFPPEDTQGRPGFPNLLGQLAEVWKNNRDELLEQAEKIAQRMRRQAEGQGKVLGLEPELLDQAVSELAQRFDRQNGGFGRAPKFPAPANVQLLLRYHSRSQDPRVLEMVTGTLDGMARGGIYDHLGGGFARYAVDENWLVPHFEKMLYDNAQLATVYLEGFQATQTPLYRQVAVETLDYILREMTSPEGGFYSATDADSEGEEGKFFVWTPAEVNEVLGESKGAHFCAFYDVTPEGNFEGKNVLHAPKPLNQVAASLGMDAGDLEKELAESRAQLFEARSKRVKPGLDDKIVTAWNGLMITALAQGYRILGDSRYLEAANKAAAFLQAKLTTADGRLLRTYRNGKAHLNAYLEDYACLGEALLTLYEAGGNWQHFQWAQQLAELALRHFSAEDGGFYDTSDDHEELLVRNRTGNDGAIPSGQGVMALLLIRLSYHLEKPEWRQRSLDVLTSQGKELRQFAAGFCRHLLALDYALAGPLEIVWTVPASPRLPLMDSLARHYLPNHIVAWPGHPRAEGKTTGTLHLCQTGTCAEPVSDPDDLVKQLGMLRSAIRFELHARIGGAATAAATAALAAKRPAGYRKLGRTDLTVSLLGFGGYRVDDENAGYADALQAALDGGVNLIDTSTNYADGGSERLVGSLLRSSSERRSELVVVTKAGYVQGTNMEVAMARQQMGHPYPEMVQYEQGCWHCLHPEFLADQLERSTMRLSLEKLDVLLLHNPEYFLMDCEKRGESNHAAVRAEFERRLENAFAFLEMLAKEGRISWYGVSSNTFAGPEDKLTTVSLSRVLEIARKVGGDEHHFAVVQVPLNLLESAAAEGFAKEAMAANLGVLINRPMNAFVQQTLARLADFEPDSEPVDFSASLEALAELEGEYRKNFGPFVQGPGSDQLFRFADKMQGLDTHIQNLEHWLDLESRRLRPSLMAEVGAIDNAMNGPIIEPWVAWRERYMAAFRDVCNDLEELALRKSHRLSQSVRQLLDPLLPPERKEAPLSQLACWIAASAPGVTTVLAGMRREDYVADLLPVLEWPPCQNVHEILEALKGWSNPFGVLA